MKAQRGGAEPIAVVGMALRVPGAGTPGQFWQNILDGKDSLTRSSIDELRLAGVTRKQLADPDFVRSDPLLKDIEYFDAAFFGMAEFEAERTDPAHRIFLECVWEAMEAAGIVADQDGLVTGVFGGTEGKYSSHNLDHMSGRANGDEEATNMGSRLQIALGNELDYFATRVSHKFDLTGPSIAVMAACATSLLAVHLAVQSLRRRECDVAVAGGGTVMLPQLGGYTAGVEGMMSPSGRVKPFDADADGTVFGNGVGVVVLRPLDDALADGNPICAVIRGSAASNDGNPDDKESFIAPSSKGQALAIEAAMAEADIGGDSIGYLEAHGTGTLLGDPVEITSIADVYRRDTVKTGYCALGSVKANVGHLRTAAGVVGLMRACLALENRILPPQANFVNHNSRIDFESSPFYINTEPLEWAEGPHPRRAAVSSFGFGGANAHAVVEEFVRPPSSASSRRHHLFTLSAKTESALARRLTDLADCLDGNPELDIADVAHTLQCGREAMPRRACLHIDKTTFKPSDLMLATPVASGVAKSRNRPVVFLFPGQGAQRPGMGQDLYAREPVYRDIVDRCAMLLQPALDFDIRTLIHIQPGQSADDKAAALRQTGNAQPALFVVEYALARLFMSWGVKPEAMLGHSIGEIVAACIAGVFSLENALKLVAARAKLMQQCAPGTMAAVFLPEAELREVLGDDLEIAALNAPTISVVSGPTDEIERFLDKMEDAGVGTRRVETSHAFHSRMMDPALPAFRAVLRDIELSAPGIPVISNATGVAMTAEQATDPGYWSDHLRHTVRCSGGLEHLLEDDDRVYLELGPGRTLADLVRQHDAEADTFAALEKKATGTPDEEQHTAMVSLGRLWCAGAAVDWRDFYAGEKRQKVALPTYPFERRRYWIEPGEMETTAERGLYLYEPGWRMAELEQIEALDEGRPWLIFRDKHGLGVAISERLREENYPVISLVPGDRFAELDPNTFTVRPSSQEDLQAALSKAGALDGGQVPQVLHLWSVTGPSGEHNTVEAFRQSNLTGYHSLVALTKAAYDNGMCDGLDVLVVADGLRQIDGEDSPLHAEKGALIGPARSIAKEIPGMTLRCADISGFADGNAVDALSDAIIAEARGRDRQHSVCLRQQGRYVEAFYPLTNISLGRVRFRECGTVLITGGVGGLGLLVAETLFDAVQARLVLTSRWQPPPREQWAARADEDSKIGRALRRVLALEARGAEVLIVATDIADMNGLRQAVNEAQSRFGGINGVVHAAGAIDDGPILRTTQESTDRLFEAKVHGAFNLEEIFAQTSLDIFIHFSSQASYYPGLGQVAYTASNNVLDILANRRAREKRGMSCAIGWGAWEESGMAVAAVNGSGSDARPPDRADDDLVVSGTLDHPLLRTRHDGENGRVIYRGLLRDDKSWVFEHRFGGRPLFAGMAILECLYATYIDRVGDEKFVAFSQFAFLNPLFIDDEGIQLEIEYTPNGDEDRVEVRSRKYGSLAEWTVNVTGSARVVKSRPSAGTALQLPGLSPVSTAIYEGGFISVGPRWDCVTGVKIEDDSTWVRVRLADEFQSDLDSFRFHSALFDRAIHEHAERFVGESVPYTFEEIRLYAAPGAEFNSHGMHRNVSGLDTFDFRFFDDHGNVLVEIDAYVMRAIKGSSLERSTDPDDRVLGLARTALDENHRIVVTQPGNLDSLQAQIFEPRPPGPGEVQLEVVAVGLNFRDVLSALGQMPVADGDSPAIGGECSGIVRAVGEGVSSVGPGDPVVTMAADAFAGLVTTTADMVLPVPPNVSMEEAAGIPIVFLTADYAINQVACLKEGERILIHAAAGGVGLAAVQIAQRIGAEIFATAGHPDKRQYLESLGVEHVMDSRSLDFVDEIRARTNGEGVDVVLNSLAGEFIPAGLGLLRYRGRFLEIGKRDILADTKIGLLPFLNNLSYHAIDIGQMNTNGDPVVARLFDALMLKFSRGDLVPIPTAVIPIDDLAQGMNRMAHAEHIGKIVFKVRDDPDPWRASFKKFQEKYGRGVSVRHGLETFRRLLSSDGRPSYVLALGNPIDEVGRVEHRIGEREKSRLDLATDYRAPTSTEEEALVVIWEKTLGVAPIGVDDDFFDLGGDSITAIQIQFSVASACGVKLPTTVLFDHPTVCDLADLIRETAN